MTGNLETICVMDMKSRKPTPHLRKIPRNRRTHIKVGLSIGMNVTDINNYLGLMRFAPLDPDDPQEGELIRQIDMWVKEHPYTDIFKNKFFADSYGPTEEDVLAALRMLNMRQTLAEKYMEMGREFPFS